MYPHLFILFATIGRPVHSLFWDTGVFAKIILLILFVISVVSWAIMWDRTRLYLRLRKRGETARKDIEGKSLGTMLSSVNNYSPSVEGSILMETKRFLQEWKAGTLELSTEKSNSNEAEDPKRMLRGRLERRAMEEISEMEKYLVFLATTSGVSPFLGLLGTVWGIMSSFLSMGIQGTASIEVVGPGIAEALVTTIAGLGAAIPALVGYNLLGRYVQRQDTRIDLFINRIMEKVEPAGPTKSIPRSEAAYEKNSV